MLIIIWETVCFQSKKMLQVLCMTLIGSNRCKEKKNTHKLSATERVTDSPAVSPLDQARGLRACRRLCSPQWRLQLRNTLMLYSQMWRIAFWNSHNAGMIIGQCFCPPRFGLLACLLSFYNKVFVYIVYFACLLSFYNKVFVYITATQ